MAIRNGACVVVVDDAGRLVLVCAPPQGHPLPPALRDQHCHGGRAAIAAEDRRRQVHSGRAAQEKGLTFFDER